MYYIKKQIEISAAHRLDLPNQSKCTEVHGHNWKITIYCKSDRLNENGMVVDFTHIKQQVKDRLDHKLLNDVLPGLNPTAEHIAHWICTQVEHCYRVDVQESDGNMASYEADEA